MAHLGHQLNILLIKISDYYEEIYIWPIGRYDCFKQL